jgi:plasmid stability protein
VNARLRRYHCHHAKPIVRKIDEAPRRALKARAARNRRSAEAEHREILPEALAPRPGRRTFTDALLEMPDIGEDADFERPRDMGRTVAS